MNRRLKLMIALACVATAAGLIAVLLRRTRPVAAMESRDAAAAIPKVVLWAWERPDDLSFIDTSRIGVAYLAGTIRLDGSHIIMEPRAQPLTLPEGARLVAVVRIEAREAASLKHVPQDQLAARIAKLALAHQVQAVQIDFDALKSQRTFYRGLLDELRRVLPKGMPLTITALASWCIYDDWIDNLPVDDAVPMVFRMGADRLRVLSRLDSGGDFRSPNARSSVGIAVDEKIERLPAGRRIYAFNPKPWTRESVAEVMSEVTRWQ